MSTKDEILRNTGVGNRFGAPPIDAGMQSLPPQAPVSTADQTPKPAPTLRNDSFPVDNSLRGLASPAESNEHNAKWLGEEKPAALKPNPVITTDTKRIEPTPDTTTTQQEDKPLSYVEMFQRLNPYNPPSDEELEKERKKRKREAIFNAVSDGIQALSNLYFTTQYAPNSYNPRNSLSAKAQQRWEKVDADRNANRDKYFNFLLNKYKLQDDADKEDLGWRRTLERDRKADAQQAFNNTIAQAKEDRDQKLADLNMQLYNHKITAAEADAKRKEAQAKYEEQYQKARVDHEKAAAGASRASAGASNAAAGASRARGRYYDRGGSSKKAEFVGYDKNGKAYYFTDAKAAEQFARRNGTWNEGKQTSTVTTSSTNEFGEKSTRTATTTKKGNGYSKPKFNANNYKRGGGGSKTNTKPPLN